MTHQINPLLYRRPPGGISRFETDRELSDFINTLDRYHTIKGLRAQLVEHFGNERAPSISSIHRYLQKITRAASQDQGESKHE